MGKSLMLVRGLECLQREGRMDLWFQGEGIGSGKVFIYILIEGIGGEERYFYCVFRCLQGFFFDIMGVRV